MSINKQSTDLENIFSENTVPSEVHDSNITANSNMTQSFRTTGWQRWCVNVEQASSTAQLHLLARALERGAHRATLGGRGVSSAIANYVSQHPLPALKCTSCRYVLLLLLLLNLIRFVTLFWFYFRDLNYLLMSVTPRSGA